MAAGCDAVPRLSESADAEAVVEVALFEGGYGIHWHQKIAEQYNRELAPQGVRVRVWGDPRVADKIKPRLLRGDPPDLLFLAGLPIWLLISTGKVYPLDGALDRPGYGSEKPWRELFIPGTLDSYMSDDKVYALPTAFNAWACWYDAKLFREHGWRPPKTWSEFDRLCDRIRRAGIAPLAFQGKYPAYGWYTYISLVQRCGGLAAINRLNALEVGAFSHPDAVWAARLLQEMAVKHFQKGAMAMTHTDSQLQFVNRQAAMIFCGIWLENEMRSSTPPDFHMRCFNVPAVENGKGNPTLFLGQGGEFLFVPSDASHKELALDFARFLISLVNGPDMGASIGVVSPLVGGARRDMLSPALQSVLDVKEQAAGMFRVRLNELLLEWTNQVMCPNLTALMQEEITPETFCKRLDDGLAAARSNPDIVVPAYRPYDPAQFGEPP